MDYISKGKLSVAGVLLKFVNNDPTLPESWRKYFNEIGDEADTIINEINCMQISSITHSIVYSQCADHA